MAFTTQDVGIIRSLAKRVAEIAALPVQQERRELWASINRLERVRPLIHVQAISWDIWEELLPKAQLQTTDPFCQAQETALRRCIYCWEHFQDDRVVDDVVRCPLAIRGEAQSVNFGIPRKMDRSTETSGAHAYVPVIVEERDIDRIDTEPVVTVDWDDTERRYQLLLELYGGILRVEKRGTEFFWFQPVDQFITRRGIQQTFIDMIDRPKWVHAGLERMTAAYLSSIKQIEALGALSLGNGNTMLGSGGYGWTAQLPKPGFDGQHVRLKDLWARAATQLFTEGISPAMHDEFALHYEKQLLAPFGLSCYGCCEPLDMKMDIVRQIPNLRRVSMSPWVDVEKGAERIGQDLVFSRKPSPALLAVEDWDPAAVEKDLSETLDACKRHGCPVELILKDISTVRYEPQRLWEWADVAMRVSGA